jgi:hypothetical protein
MGTATKGPWCTDEWAIVFQQMPKIAKQVKSSDLEQMGKRRPTWASAASETRWLRCRFHNPDPQEPDSSLLHHAGETRGASAGGFGARRVRQGSLDSTDAVGMSPLMQPSPRCGWAPGRSGWSVSSRERRCLPAMRCWKWLWPRG